MIRINQARTWLATAGACALAATACSTNGAASHPMAHTRLWQQYEGLAESRALVVAGNPTKNWVAAMAGGQPSVRAALDEAMAECLERRAKRRMQASCRPYAEGKRIVWDEQRSSPR